MTQQQMGDSGTSRGGHGGPPLPLLVAVAAVAAGAAFVSCVPTPEAPEAVVLGTVVSPTSVDVQTLRGTKQASTGVEVLVRVGGVDRETLTVPLSDDTQWTLDVALDEGTNQLVVAAVDAAGRRSPEVSALIVLDTEAPDEPEVDALPPRTALDSVEVTGSVGAGDDVVINGRLRSLGGAGFEETVALAVGTNRIRVAARDLAGNESDVVEHVIERLDAVPFTVDDAAVPAIVNAAGLPVVLNGTRGEGVEVSINGIVVVDAASDVGDGTWIATVDVAGSAGVDADVLSEGDNIVEITGAFPGESETAVRVVVAIDVDTIAPNDPAVDALPPFTALDSIDVTGTVAGGDDVVIDGVLVPLAGATAFAAPVALVVGANTITVRARDAAGNESGPVVVVTERVAEVPFTFDAPPALVNASDVPLSFSGTRGEGVEVRINDVVVVDSDAPVGDGTWSVEVTLVEGDNAFVVTGGFPGEAATAITENVTVTSDTIAPTVALLAPALDALAGPSLDVDGTAADGGASATASGLVFTGVCIGPHPDVDALACTADADFTALTLTNDAFATTLDLDSGALATALDDGALAVVHVRAEDAAGNVTDVARDVLVFRAPLVVAEAVGTVVDVDLARPSAAALVGGGAGASTAVVSGALAWANAAGDAGLALDVAEGPLDDDASVSWNPADIVLATGGGANASEVRVASNNGVLHVVWIDGGDLMYAQLEEDDAAPASGNGVPGTATPLVALVVDGSGAAGPVTSADVTFDASGVNGPDEAIVAFAQSGNNSVSIALSSTGAASVTFDAPVVASDATTAAPDDVTLAPGGIAVAWVETSARDGSLEAGDSDVVLARVVDGAPGAPALMSGSQGAFTDSASSTTPDALALDNGEVALAWIDATGTASARAVLSRVTLAGGPAPVPNVPVEVTGPTAVPGAGATLDLFLAVDENDADIVLVGWLDDGAPLLATTGAPSPGFVVRRGTLAALGAATVVTSSASAGGASSPTGFLRGTRATLSWIEAGEALLVVKEVP